MPMPDLPPRRDAAVDVTATAATPWIQQSTTATAPPTPPVVPLFSTTSVWYVVETISHKEYTRIMAATKVLFVALIIVAITSNYQFVCYNVCDDQQSAFLCPLVDADPVSTCLMDVVREASVGRMVELGWKGGPPLAAAPASGVLGPGASNVTTTATTAQRSSATSSTMSVTTTIAPIGAMIGTPVPTPLASASSSSSPPAPLVVQKINFATRGNITKHLTSLWRQNTALILTVRSLSYDARRAGTAPVGTAASFTEVLFGPGVALLFSGATVRCFASTASLLMQDGVNTSGYSSFGNATLRGVGDVVWLSDEWSLDVDLISDHAHLAFPDSWDIPDACQGLLFTFRANASAGLTLAPLRSDATTTTTAMNSTLAGDNNDAWPTSTTTTTLSATILTSNVDFVILLFIWRILCLVLLAVSLFLFCRSYVNPYDRGGDAGGTTGWWHHPCRALKAAWTSMVHFDLKAFTKDFRIHFIFAVSVGIFCNPFLNSDTSSSSTTSSVTLGWGQRFSWIALLCPAMFMSSVLAVSMSKVDLIDFTFLSKKGIFAVGCCMIPPLSICLLHLVAYFDDMDLGIFFVAVFATKLSSLVFSTDAPVELSVWGGLLDGSDAPSLGSILVGGNGSSSTPGTGSSHVGTSVAPMATTGSIHTTNTHGSNSSSAPMIVTTMTTTTTAAPVPLSGSPNATMLLIQETLQGWTVPTPTFAVFCIMCACVVLWFLHLTLTFWRRQGCMVYMCGRPLYKGKMRIRVLQLRFMIPIAMHILVFIVCCCLPIVAVFSTFCPIGTHLTLIETFLSTGFAVVNLYFCSVQRWDPRDAPPCPYHNIDRHYDDRHYHHHRHYHQSYQGPQQDRNRFEACPMPSPSGAPHPPPPPQRPVHRYLRNDVEEVRPPVPPHGVLHLTSRGGVGDDDGGDEMVPRGSHDGGDASTGPAPQSSPAVAPSPLSSVLRGGGSAMSPGEPCVESTSFDAMTLEQLTSLTFSVVSLRTGNRRPMATGEGRGTNGGGGTPHSVGLFWNDGAGGASPAGEASPRPPAVPLCERNTAASSSVGIVAPAAAAPAPGERWPPTAGASDGSTTSSKAAGRSGGAAAKGGDGGDTALPERPSSSLVTFALDVVPPSAENDDHHRPSWQRMMWTPQHFRWAREHGSGYIFEYERDQRDFEQRHAALFSVPDPNNDNKNHRAHHQHPNHINNNGGSGGGGGDSVCVFPCLETLNYALAMSKEAYCDVPHEDHGVSIHLASEERSCILGCVEQVTNRANQKESDEPSPEEISNIVRPLNVSRYGYEIFRSMLVHDVQIIIALAVGPSIREADRWEHVMVSFRGTANMSNAVTDIGFGRAGINDDDKDEESAVGWGAPKVHSGFYGVFKAMRQPLREALAAAVVVAAEKSNRGPMAPSHRPNTIPIVLTGHSLGGALATLAAYTLSTTPTTTTDANTATPPPPPPLFNPLTVYTFGSPRVGNAAFRRAYDAAVPRTFRVVNENDTVASFHHCMRPHVGKLIAIDRDGNLMVDPQGVEKKFNLLSGNGSAMRNHLMRRYARSVDAVMQARGVRLQSWLKLEKELEWIDNAMKKAKKKRDVERQRVIQLPNSLDVIVYTGGGGMGSMDVATGFAVPSLAPDAGASVAVEVSVPVPSEATPQLEGHHKTDDPHNRNHHHRDTCVVDAW